MPDVRVLGIFGTGLIGASIGMRARRNGTYVVGYDRDPAAAARARALGAIDAVVTRDEIYARAGTVAIAAHLTATIAELERLHGSPPAAAIVDVASVKGPVCEAARGLANFVATHPMAGSERSGPESADPELFEGRTWAYVPAGNRELNAHVCRFIESLGALPLAIDPSEHDRVVAFGSHLPQIVAWIYARQARERDVAGRRRLAGAAARELLRLGACESAMWGDVLRVNAANVEPELRALGSALLEAAERLRAGRAIEPAAIGRRDPESTTWTEVPTESRSADTSP
ncbi:MAG TPA: prephenate dehydrogenase/arogenate dehydrogenase family protein [Candidatus Tumulicola sp.]